MLKLWRHDGIIYLQTRGLHMLKLNKVENPKNKFFIQYNVCHTDVNENDRWMTMPAYELSGIEDFDDLTMFIGFFNAVKDEIIKSRTGYGYSGDSIDFETLAEDHDIQNVEWCRGDGISFEKNGKEFFIDVGTDIGMPTEDGHFLCGIDIELITYFDKDGIEYIVEEN